MNAQTIVTPQGERLVVLAEADYHALVAALEDRADLATVEAFERKLASGEEELLPQAVADRLIDGQNAIRVWREHRGMKAVELAAKAGVGQGHLSQIENGKRQGGIATLGRIATALGISVDDLVG